MSLFLFFALVEKIGKLSQRWCNSCKYEFRKTPLIYPFYTKVPLYVIVFTSNYCKITENVGKRGLCTAQKFKENVQGLDCAFIVEKWFYTPIDTAQKMKFSIKDFFSKCDQIRSFLRIWSNLLKKSLMENLIFCAVW